MGVNSFQVKENLELESLAADPAIEQNAKNRLAELKTMRDSKKVNELLSRLENAANEKDNLMPLFILCVENSITLGEICAVLRRVWGEYQPPAWS